MILLVDAHALLWWLDDNQTLRREAHAAIASPANDVLVSAATIWEIGIKRQAGRLTAPTDLAGAMMANNMSGLPITTADAETASALPMLHRYPFDRMLVAQARRLGAVLVTRDRAFDPYGVEILRA